ncbi:MAG: divalent-cation tolerance protein CutA [Candidatus Liptonbacteria bacterium]|nr:divalent-cation tolerance protein CutA [Candidatus Liptonbacteria bacterium]
MVLIYTTCKDTAEAVKLGKIVLDGKLASCVNIWPIQSMYYWKDELKSHLEAGMFIKTLEHHIAEIEGLIEKNHSYSTPYIGAVEVRRFNRTYREWMTTVVKP